MSPARRLFHDLFTRWRRLIRNRNTMAWMIIIPIVIISIIGIILPDDDSVCSVYVQNKDSSLYGVILESMLVNDYSAVVIDPGADTAVEIDRIEKENPKQSIIVVVIPEGFSHYVSDYKSGNEFRVQLSDGGISLVMDIMKVVDEDYDDGYAHITVHNSHRTSLFSDAFRLINSNSNLVKQVYPGIAVSMVLLIVSGITVGVMQTEKESRLDVIFRNTRYNRGIQTVSMVIWALLPSALVFTLSYATICCFQFVEFDPRVIAGLVLVSTMGVSFGMLMSELVKGAQSMAIANASVLFALLLLSGGIFPKNMLSARMSEIGSYVPVTYLIDIIRCSMGYGGDFIRYCLMSILFIGMILAAWYGLVKLHERGE